MALPTITPEIKSLHTQVLQIRDELSTDVAGLTPPMPGEYRAKRVQEMEVARTALSQAGFQDAADGSLIHLDLKIHQSTD